MVKCSECGFLAARKTGTFEFGPPGITEMQDYQRQKAVINQNVFYEPEPVCTMGIAWFAERVKQPPTGAVPDLKPLIESEHECSEFYPYKIGVSPNEHRQMRDSERMLTWQANESKANRRYRIVELLLVLATIAVVLIAAFIEKSGQPTINNIIQAPTPPSTSGTGVTPP